MTASAAGKCELRALAQVPVVYEGGRLLVAATINGHPTHMLVDSGASLSLIFRGAAAAFGMEIVGGGGKAYTAGGIENAGRVTVRDFNLAGFVVHDLTLTTSGHGAMSASLEAPTGSRRRRCHSVRQRPEKVAELFRTPPVLAPDGSP